MKPPIWWAIWLLMCVVAYGWNVYILRGYKVKKEKIMKKKTNVLNLTITIIMIFNFTNLNWYQRVSTALECSLCV